MEEETKKGLKSIILLSLRDEDGKISSSRLESQQLILLTYIVSLSSLALISFGKDVSTFALGLVGILCGKSASNIWASQTTKKAKQKTEPKKRGEKSMILSPAVLKFAGIGFVVCLLFGLALYGLWDFFILVCLGGSSVGAAKKLRDEELKRRKRLIAQQELLELEMQQIEKKARKEGKNTTGNLEDRKKRLLGGLDD